ncbi:hypothetical protein DPMN_056917 [Dreissena polymorpha]|uniref:Uncharacterized protein n=1 Tax=Dreissena polymorpha TaxID=45954 RepID=A0A9D4HTY7_DREPO|nr:hypothetical protein DPMN_056917 [Dreissena polymorpha]
MLLTNVWQVLVMFCATAPVCKLFGNMYLNYKNNFCDSVTVQPTRNKHTSRSTAARRNESMPSQPLKPQQFVAASRISQCCFASVRRDMPRQAAIRDITLSRCAS